MPLCQGCGSELSGTERFCRNCGAPIATLVEDLVETHRFNPNKTDPQPPYAAPENPTNPLFRGSPAAQPVVAGAGAIASTRPGSLIRHLLQHKFAWVLIFVLISLFAVGGFTVVRNIKRERGGRIAEPRRPSIDERVRSSLGFDLRPAISPRFG